MKKEDKRKNNGGPGKGGRKKIADEDKVVQVARYFKKKDIEKIGGKEAVNELFDNTFKEKLELNQK